MRTYSELNETERATAVERAMGRLLAAICEGALRFNDELNGEDLQSRIDAGLARAEELRTPWFASEYVLDAARDELEAMARSDAEDCLYLDPDEMAVRL